MMSAFIPKDQWSRVSEQSPGPREEFTFECFMRPQRERVAGSPRTQCPNVNLVNQEQLESSPRCFNLRPVSLQVLPAHHSTAKLLCSNIGLAFSEFSSEEFTRSVSWRMTTSLRDLPHTILRRECFATHRARSLVAVEHGFGAVMGIENKRKKTHNEINHWCFPLSSPYDCKPKVLTASVGAKRGMLCETSPVPFRCSYAEPGPI
jgi:hypothetical protein